MNVDDLLAPQPLTGRPRPAWLPPGASADLIAARDWSGTALGAPEGWPASLRTTLGLMLHAPTPMTLLWGPEGLLFFNDAAGAIIGPRRAEVLGQPVRDSFPAFRPLNDEVLRRCLGGEVLSVRERPFAFPGPEPRTVWFDIDYLPVADDGGRPTGALANIVDVTARVLAERAREESETRLRALVDNLPGAVVYQVDSARDMSDRRFTYVSASAEALLGIPADAALADPMAWFAAVHPDDLPRVAEAERRAAEALALLDVEVRALRPDGAVVLGRVLSRPREAPGGRLLWDGMFLDRTEALEAEAEIQRSNRLLQAIGAATPDLVYAKDRESRLLYANPATARLIGAPLEQLVGSYLEDWADNRAEAEAIRLNDLRIMEEGRTVGFEEVYTGADGQTRHFRTVKSPLRDDGAVTGLVGLSGDITDMKRAETELRELNATLEERVAEALADRRLWAEVFEGTDALISVVSPDLRVLAANRAALEDAERQTGRRPKIGDQLADILAPRPELLGPIEALWRRALAGEAFLFAHEIGDTVYELRFEPLCDEAGRVYAAFQIATDVTARVRAQRRADAAETARAESDALYRAYFQNSGEALFVVGVRPDGGFTFEEVNPTHRDALGLDVAAAPGRRIEEVLPPGLAETVAANYRRVLESGELQRYRETADLGGRVVHAETVLVPVRDETGRIVRIVGSARDMTAQVQAEEALRQSQKLESMGSLTGGVAHDFNNLLTPIIASLDMLQRRGVGDERMRRLVDGALQSAERAKTLVQRLLAFARRQPLQPVALDLGFLVEGMAELVASTVGPRVRVETAIAPGLPVVRADANQLEMAILNLAVNARDAMPDGGRLRIEAGLDGDRPATLPSGQGFARLSVTDSGLGMDGATLARAVEPFFSTKGVGRGTGLGLSMVHGLASQLGGALELRSRPGEGTTVTLWLPLAEGAPARAEAAETTAGAPSAGTVLLVDDEELVRASTAQMLLELGYAVEEASSAEDALRRLDEGLAPDLIVTDHLMPGLTGTDLARAVRGGERPVPVLLISGYADDAGLPPDLPRLTKPFRQAELAAALGGLSGGTGPAEKG